MTTSTTTETEATPIALPVSITNLAKRATHLAAALTKAGAEPKLTIAKGGHVFPSYITITCNDQSLTVLARGKGDYCDWNSTSAEFLDAATQH